MKTTQQLSCSGESVASEREQAVNPSWLAFFRRVRELAELARERESRAEHSAHANASVDVLSGRQPADAATIPAAHTNKKAPAGTGAYAKPQDCFSTTPKDFDYYEHTR